MQMLGLRRAVVSHSLMAFSVHTLFRTEESTGSANSLRSINRSIDAFDILINGGKSSMV